MKILHVAQDRDAAFVAERVIHGIAQNVTPTWVQAPAAALQWLQVNPDTAAVIVEVHAQSCASFVEELRGRGLTMPVVVVAGSARLEPALAALNAGADGCVVAGPSLEAVLPRTVAAAIDRERRRRQILMEPLLELAVDRERVVQQLARVEEARRQIEHRSASELDAAAERLADVQARSSESLAHETGTRLALQQKLIELESALRQADERRASEAVSFADQLAKRHAEFTASLTHAAQSRDALAAELSVVTAALGEARQARRADAAAAAEHLHRRETELRAELIDAVAVQTALDEALAESEAAHQDTRQRAAIDLAAANERQAALEDLLAQEADRRTSVDRKLTAAEAAHQEADRRHAAEVTTAAARFAELHARHDATLEEHAGERAAFERHKSEAASAIERVTRERTAEAAAAAGDLAAAAARQAALENRLAQETARGLDLEQQLSAAETARQDNDSRHAAELLAAGIHLASLQRRYDTAVTDHAATHVALEQRLIDAATAHQAAEDRAAAALAAASAREAALVERLTREADTRAALERDLAGARMESARGRDRSLSVVSTHRRRAREQKVRFDAQLVQSQLEQETLQRRLGTTHDQLQHLHRIVDEERQAHELARSTSESELQRVSAEYGQIRESFDRLQSAFQTLEQIAGEHASERARLETVVADRDSQLSAQAERHRVAEQGAHDAIVELQSGLRQVLDTSGSEIARLQREGEGLRRELEATWTHAEALRGVAERVPDLQTQLERSQSERRGQFERAPYALCRCSESGAITDANHSFVTLLGYRRVEELRNMDFVAAALDSAGDLRWLLERARTTRKTETVEAQWKTAQGRRLVVRLQALATATGSVDIAAEDLTSVRALEDRLRQAERMEAVGRLASEVAVTCDTLLGDVTRGAHEWLARAGSDDALRRHVEHLLTDLTRAASFLRQLEMFGNEQARALEPVSAQRVLQDLAPVLKRLLSDQIELVLPKSAGSFNVDVEAERLERVLINVAGYARERMPSGGQVMIDLATTTVGRRLVSRYPHVRPGEHVLLTVTELSSAGDVRGDSEPGPQSSDKPGVDLGVLAGLIDACGGHLWLDAQPGNMVLKIQLPKPPAAVATDNRGGRLSRWFRSMSAANDRA